MGAEDDPDRTVGDRPDDGDGGPIHLGGDGDHRPAPAGADRDRGSVHLGGDDRPAHLGADDDRGPVHLGEDQVRIRLEEAEHVDVDALIAEHDADRPARRLGGPIAIAVAVIAGVLSAWVLVSVFRPRVELQYRMTFLAVVLPLTFLVYRPGFRRRARCG